MFGPKPENPPSQGSRIRVTIALAKDAGELFGFCVNALRSLSSRCKLAGCRQTGRIAWLFTRVEIARCSERLIVAAG